MVQLCFALAHIGFGSFASSNILNDALVSDNRALIVLHNPERRQAHGLNLAAERASGEILVRADGHTAFAPDYVRASVAALEETGGTTHFSGEQAIGLDEIVVTGTAGGQRRRAVGNVVTSLDVASRLESFDGVAVLTLGGSLDPRCLVTQDAAGLSQQGREQY